MNKVLISNKEDKNGIVNEETKLYKRILIITLVGLMLEIASALMFRNESSDFTTNI